MEQFSVTKVTKKWKSKVHNWQGKKYGLSSLVIGDADQLWMNCTGIKL